MDRQAKIYDRPAGCRHAAALVERYQHIIAAIRRDVVAQIGELLWEPIEEQPDNRTDDGRGKHSG